MFDRVNYVLDRYRLPNLAPHLLNLLRWLLERFNRPKIRSHIFYARAEVFDDIYNYFLDALYFY